MSQDPPEYDAEHRKPQKRRCHARWWTSDDEIAACSAEPLPRHRRCAAHAPDGSRIDAQGEPLPEQRAQCSPRS